MQVTGVDVTTVEVERRYGFGTSTCSFVELAADTGIRGIGEISAVGEPAARSTEEASAAANTPVADDDGHLLPRDGLDRDLDLDRDRPEARP
jgi:L-alanine-DL-glutamate epimerase-like enolase superfamily enzyme